MAEMTWQEALEWGKTLDFPTVWSMVTKLGERIDKIGERIDKMGERIDQTTENIDKLGERVDQTTENINKMGERVDQTTANVNKLSENVGGLNRSIGELVETLIAARLWEKFPEYKLQRAYRRLPLYDEKNIDKGEVDILLVNTEWAMAVEVKREADAKDVEHHIERMARILKYSPPWLPANIKLLGAIAGGVVVPEAKEAAHKAGFYVLELAGESVIRVPEPAGFKPKEW